MIYNPIPAHKQIASTYLMPKSFPITEKTHNEAFSLPISLVMEAYELNRIIDVLN
ncbi:MAG: UDP-4-amino-4-deoxy-L-arabinose--oxoglutarate aminotransferase [Bacteroidota bacterium]|jgi:dTDP-4-amino-4,6-dideoxygalactose transaminase